MRPARSTPHLPLPPRPNILQFSLLIKSTVRNTQRLMVSNLRHKSDAVFIPRGFLLPIALCFRILAFSGGSEATRRPGKLKPKQYTENSCTTCPPFPARRERCKSHSKTMTEGGSVCKIHILYHQNKNKKAPRFVLGQSRNIKVCFIFYKILKIDICWKLQRPLLQPVHSLVELNCKGYKDSVARIKHRLRDSD